MRFRQRYANDKIDESVESKPARARPIMPLWALMLGPLWIVVFLVMLAIYSLICVVWIVPTMIACEVFGWSMPKGLTPSWLGDEYEVMP
jgi:hypothetical protein